MKDTINPDGTRTEGSVITAYMPKFRVLEHAKKFSKSYNRKTGTFSGPWASDFDSMARKTVLLQALKYAPKASEDAMFANAFTMDNTVRDGIEKDASTIKTEGIFAANPADGAIDAEVVEENDGEMEEANSEQTGGEE